MRAVDTSVLIRLMVRDDPEQVDRTLWAQGVAPIA